MELRPRERYLLDVGLELDKDWGRWLEDRGGGLLALAVCRSFRKGAEQWLERWELLPHLKQRPSLMRRSRLEDPSRAYPKVLVSISMALGCLG